MKMNRLVAALLCLALAGPAFAQIGGGGISGPSPGNPGGGNIGVGMAARATLGVGNYTIPFDYDKLCNGTQPAHDCSTATNTAAAVTINGVSPNVHLQAGKYFVTSAITLQNGQTLYGDGVGNTLMLRDKTFSPSAAGEILLTGRERQSPTVEDIAFQDTEPTAAVSSLSAASITTNSLTATVASGMPANDNLLAGPGVTLGTVLSAVSCTHTPCQAGDSLTATLSLNSTVSNQSLTTALGRTQFVALGTCDGVTTGCAYSPNIIAVTSNRFKIRRVMCTPCWDFIANTAGNTIGGFFIEDVEMGSLDVGINLFSALDGGHLAHIHHYPFGSSGTSLQELYHDGFNYAAKFGATGTVGGVTGEVDEIAVDDFLTLNGRVTIDGANSWVQGTNWALDSYYASLESTAGDWVQIANIYATGYAPTGKCKLNFSAGRVTLGNVYTSSLASTSLCITGSAILSSGSGYLAGPSGGTPLVTSSTTGQVMLSNYKFDSGLVAVSAGTMLISNSFSSPASTTTPVATVSNGVLSLDGLRLLPNTGAGAWTVPLITQTGGTLRSNNLMVLNTSAGDVGVFSFTDNVNNRIVNSQFVGWGYSPPSGALGTYWPNGQSTFAVASLPTCDAAQDRNSVTVTDQAASPVYGAAPTGSGSLRARVTCTNGTGWRLGL